MPNLDAVKTDDINELRRHISHYFVNLADGMLRDHREFEPMEYINFAVLDICTAFYYSLPKSSVVDNPSDNYRLRFIYNLKRIADGLERNENGS